MKKNAITTALLILPSVLPSIAMAQTDNTAALQPINVYSAYAAPVNQDQTASSVTVLTEKDFADRNATYVSDVLKTVPGVAMGANGGRGAVTSLFLRGADANHTAVIIDGVKMNPVTGYGFDFGGLSLSNVDRIEVLRGEQSALWGSDAMGGVIYITTKNGLYKDKPFNVDVDFGTGSHGTYDASATVSGYNQGFYYAVHGDSHRTKGISAFSSDQFHYTSTTGTPFSTGGAVEKDKFHRDNASLRFGYDGKDRGIEFLSSHSSQTAHFDNSLPTETTIDDRTRTRETLFKLNGYLGSNEELFKHQASVSNLKTESNTVGSWGSWYDANKTNANYQLDINFDREGAIKQAFSLLGEYQKSKYQANSYSSPKTLHESSIAGEYRLLSEEDHSLSVSGRFTDNSQYENAFTGRIAGAYRLSPNFRTHASVGTAIQNPTMTEYFGYDGTYLANHQLKPEKSVGGDVGLLIESNDKRHSFDLTYFARNVKDLISTKTLSYDPTTYTGTYQAINLEGSSQIRGVELAYNSKWTDTLATFANYTFTRAKDSKGVELARRPKHTGNLGVSYQITPDFGANASVSYVGKRIDTYPHRTKMPSYTLANVGVNYQLSQNLNVYANLNNIFDKKYENLLGYGQDGRNLYVGLKGSF